MQIRFVPNGKNRTKEVVDALLHMPSGTELVFEKGTYDFYADGTYCSYYFIGCNRSGEKRVAFPLLNLKNVTVDGNGSSFVFHDRIFPFVIQNCENVIFRNFSIDFSFPRCLEAVVGKMDEDGFELLIDDQSNYEVNDGRNLLISAGSEIFSSSERRYFLEQKSWHCFISVGDIYYENVDPPADVIYCDAEKTDGGVYLRYKSGSVTAKFEQNKRILLSYDELRENDVFFFEYVKDTLLEDVHIIHGAGMGVVGQCCENMHFNRYVVAPNEGDLYSTTADGILLTNFIGKVIIENSVIDRSIDDAISIHGFYTRVEKITDRKKAIVRLVHPSQRGVNLYFPTDVLYVSDGENMNEKGKITVKRSYLREDPQVLYLEFEEEVEGRIQVGDYLGNDDRTPEVEIRNNVFHDFPAIRLSSSKKTLFENNIVSNANGLLVNDLMRYWSVTGCVRDLTIQNNVFENCKSAIHIFVDRPIESSVKHANIKIVQNTIKNCPLGIVAECVDGLVIRDNVFENVSEQILVKNCLHADVQ